MKERGSKEVGNYTGTNWAMRIVKRWATKRATSQVKRWAARIVKKWAAMKEFDG